MNNAELQCGNEKTKNLIDLYKVVSEEIRHTANVIWSFAVAILGFQGVAIKLAIESDRLLPKLALIPVALLSLAFSAMLIRQAHDRRCIKDRLVAVEAKLKGTYSDCFPPFTGEFSEFKSINLAWWIFRWSAILVVSSVAWSVGTVICDLSGLPQL